MTRTTHHSMAFSALYVRLPCLAPHFYAAGSRRRRRVCRPASSAYMSALRKRSQALLPCCAHGVPVQSLSSRLCRNSLTCLYLVRVAQALMLRPPLPGATSLGSTNCVGDKECRTLTDAVDAAWSAWHARRAVRLHEQHCILPGRRVGVA
jgi:hypothetical protein